MTIATIDDLQAALDKGLLRHVRLLQFSMAISPLVWLAVGILSVMGQPVRLASDGPGSMFLACVGLAAIVLFALSKILPERRLKAVDLDRLFEVGLTVAKIPVTRDRTLIVAYVLRQYYLLGSALVAGIGALGLFVIFVAGGAVKSQPHYWLALGVCPIISAWLFITMPNEAKVRRLFESHFLG